jgi:hypothetical protein
MENGELKNKLVYLENKMRQLINERIQEKMREKQTEILKTNNVVEQNGVKKIELINSTPNII